MAEKRPLCIYDGEIKELVSTDSLPMQSSASSYPKWKIELGEMVTVEDRQEYTIASGVILNSGTIVLGSESILYVR
jgi:hypothetical protein